MRLDRRGADVHWELEHSRPACFQILFISAGLTRSIASLSIAYECQTVYASSQFRAHTHRQTDRRRRIASLSVRLLAFITSLFICQVPTSVNVWACGSYGREGRCKPNTVRVLPEYWRRPPGWPRFTLLKNINDDLTFLTWSCTRH